jgi:membrane-bound lytic murein transglycosylase D
VCPNTSNRAREARTDAAKAKYQAALRSLATGKRSDLSAVERHVLALWGPGVSNATLRAAVENVRFQLGQADKFRDGVVRSGLWEPHIRDVFAEKGLPPEIAALPHVESSFNPHAYSSVGAAGLWQFMPSTGARYMRIDRAIDERYDPWRSSEAAAALMRDNYRVTGTWPLAITSYNHGAGGMMRAAKQLGTRDLGVIIERYESPTFGFASKNFYACFLAASDVERNAPRYFGAVERLRPADHEIYVTKHPTSAQALARTFGVDVGLLRELNLALREGVWQGRTAVPTGYAVRLPRVAGRASAEQLAVALPRMTDTASAAKVAGASKHRVRRGETLSMIARRYGMTNAALAKANKIRPTSKLKVGQVLRIPGSGAAVRVAESSPPASAAKPSASGATAKKKAPAAARSHTVKRGETLSSIARRSGVPLKSLAAANGLSSNYRVRAGQKLRIPDS